ncbi:efflux transporter outer membrane subunit [Azospirillum rugosum]|uniref:NodT family efflux transporter outer membrane factor (OMF) lipoprotein n=1 Tax=Azospirillum rugosum TaxID=416170 RepID=A0ABS4SLR1_9PROT|nr:efflux transporter outer membrane subunit [Azospirillum rugosum]MBP2292882.1 NodT family efflux transporter outer membrane factor (OMF) lipoprotein [Azospirillum rugosum]MDQ0529366.1 NodT family efflux transporter outer membrane factor (OMF) lipoprotein [Azospirillum rugosum]
MTTKKRGRSLPTAGTTLVSLSLLAACTVGPDYERPSAPVPTIFKEAGQPSGQDAKVIQAALTAAPRADGWRPANPQQAGLDPWWSVFNDPVLDGLMRQVEVSNQTLKASEAAYRQAQALVEESRASFFPTLSISGAGQRSGPVGSGRTSSTRTSSSSGARTIYDASLDASWAPDVWGRIRRTVESDEAAVQASAADLAAARLSAQAQLASAYVQLRIADERKKLLEASIAAFRRSLEIAQNRHAAGTATLADVFTAETQVRSTESQLIALGVQRAQLEHAIAVLIGKPPADVSLAPEPLRAAIPAIPPGIPSALLERRPDIAAAERQMAQTNALIGVAESAYYPDILINGSISNTAAIIPKLFQAPTALWAFGAQIAETLFDGGARDAVVNFRRASFDQSVALYRQTVLTAFQEVEDQLAAQRILAQQAAVQADAVRLAREAERLTLNQYRAGTLPYSSVLTAQTATLSDEENALAVQQSRLLAAVSLLQALGGRM